MSSTGKKIMPDFAFEELCEKNEEILNLYKKTDLFVSLNFDQEGQEAFLAPLKSDAADGLSVTFHNGFYELNAVAHEQVIEMRNCLAVVRLLFLRLRAFCILNLYKIFDTKKGALLWVKCLQQRRE